MLGMTRRVYGGTGELSAGAGLDMKPAILLIDTEGGFLQQAAALLQERPWEVSVELSGGSGLDRASTFSFQIVCVREELSDLPGQMVMRSTQAQRPQTMGLVYSAAGQGRIDRYDAGQVKRSITPFRGPSHLVEVMSELVGEIASMREERRYLQAFRTEHGQFLKRFADLKSRIDSLAE
jgi:DNA-binding response OmpR family regulator